jgi:hypothetical protein
VDIEAIQICSVEKDFDGQWVVYTYILYRGKYSKAIELVPGKKPKILHKNAVFTNILKTHCQRKNSPNELDIDELSKAECEKLINEFLVEAGRRPVVFEERKKVL